MLSLSKAMIALTAKISPMKWIFDPVCTRHMLNGLSDFIKFSKGGGDIQCGSR